MPLDSYQGGCLSEPSGSNVLTRGLIYYERMQLNGSGDAVRYFLLDDLAVAR